MRRRLAAVLAITVLIGLPSVLSPLVTQAASCTGWPSIRVPPTTIRVLRTGTNTVEVVNFKTYVQKVTATEWNIPEPAALRVGAIAVKQYGWYYAIHWRGGSATGGCWDVKDNTSDQIYRPTQTVNAATLAAVDATWATSLTRSGSFILTGYRSGASVSCGADVDGSHLYEYSVRKCAQAGYSTEMILRTYFGPTLTIWTGPPSPSALFITPGDQAQLTADTSATIVWREEPAAGTTITSRQVSLVMGLPRNGSCVVDRWVPALPPWQSTGASPQTATGLVPGLCYRALVQLTDSAGATTNWSSGTMYVDPAAPKAVFSTPPPTGVTSITGTSYTVRWTETPASGTHIVSRILYTERAFQPVPGTCTGASWGAISSTSAGSPVSSTGLARLGCYRYRLVLTDSAGHKSTTLSGVLMAPSA
jgi:hypothetical protein